MNEDEVLAYLRSPSATIAFDTNAIFGSGGPRDPGTELINRVNDINKLRPAEQPIRKVVPAVVLHEKLRQMRQRFEERGRTFDANLPADFIASKELTVEAFDRAHAERAAARLGQLYPRSGDWRAFKKRRCLTCVGLPESTTTPKDGKECGATVDWLIAAQAEMEGYLLVSDDKGDEFKAVTLLARLDVASAAAARLLTEVGGAAR